MGTVEDAFVMPSAWLRAIRPRRGGAPAGFRPSPTWAADVATLVAKRLSLRTSLGDARPPADIRDAGLAGQSQLDVWTVGAGRTRWTRDRPHPFGGPDPVTVSEIIRDLREVMQ